MCSGREIRLKIRIGAERTRQRSFKPQSEFNFLFRDTAGFSDGFAWERNTKLISGNVFFWDGTFFRSAIHSLANSAGMPLRHPLSRATLPLRPALRRSCLRQPFQSGVGCFPHRKHYTSSNSTRSECSLVMPSNEQTAFLGLN